MGLKEYALFEVTVEEENIIPDNVAEETAEWQYISKESINPEVIKYKGVKEARHSNEFRLFDKERKCFCSEKKSKMLWEENQKAFGNLPTIKYE